MNASRRDCLRLFSGAFGSALICKPAFASDAEKERFLQTATIVSAKLIGHGVTKPVRVELEQGDLKHSAKVQIVDKPLPDFFGEDNKPRPMKDSWHYNIAAYKIDRLLSLNMVAVEVPRVYKGVPASFSWWVEDVMFEEVDRIKNGVKPPDTEQFERQRALTDVFDELIFNIDRNLSNILITKSWQIALIDHSRAFTAYDEIRNLAKLTRCSKALMASMKSLTRSSVSKAVGPHMSSVQVASLLVRRDKIVEFFNEAAEAKGAEKVFFG